METPTLTGLNEFKPKENASYTLNCIIAPSNPNPVTKYVWFQNGMKINNESANLSFSSVKRENSGDWMCGGIINQNGVLIEKNSTDIQVNVFYLDTPVITLAPSNNTIIEGRALNLTCNATSSESVTYNWLLPNGTNVTGNILQINNINRLDAGNYSCTALSTVISKTLTTSTTTTITVFYQPGPLQVEILFGGETIQVEKANEIFKVKRDTTVSISCHVNSDEDLGIPKGKLQWFKGSSDVAIENVNVTARLASLSFQDLKKKDNGSYTCRIENEVGRQEKSIELVVLEEPGPPMNLTIETILAKSISITWVAPAFDGNSPITSYTVSYKLENDAIPMVNKTNITSINLTGLIPAMTYEINVSANNLNFSGSPSNITVVTADATPLEPLNFTVSVNVSQQLSLSWEVPSTTNGQILLYQYCYTKVEDGSQRCENTTDNSTKSAIIPNLGKYTEYNLNVSGLTSAGFGVPAEANNVFTKEEKPDPVNATVFSFARNITVKWTKPNIFGELKYYEVLINSSGSSPVLVCNGTELECLITQNHSTFNVTPNTFYLITVFVSNTLFKTGFNTSTKTLKAAPPPPPSPSPPPSNAIAKDTFQVQLVSFSEENGPISKHDIIVLALSGNAKPSRSPQSYSNVEILNGVNNLYVAVRRPGAPKSDDIVTIGNGENNQRKRRNLADPNNKALEPSTHYTVFIRAYVTDDLYSSTDWYPVIVTLREDDKMSAGLIAGIVIIIILALIIIGLLLYWLFWRRRQHRDSDTEFHSKNSKKRPISPKELDFLVPVAPNNFENHAQQLHANGNYGFNQEYLSINRELRLPYSQSRMQENNTKNRYHNVPAYDHSRVCLMSIDGEPHSDYINANYIQGYSDSKEYIATQGPLPETVFEFWRMIWETESSTIVMLTKLEEKGRVKCAQYWPENSSLSIKDIVITPTEIHDFPDHTVRSFHVTRMGQAVERVVKQFHFTSWPDFGVPQDPSALLSFMRKVNNWKGLSQCPTIIHCSAGVGRTGTYITIDTQIKRLKNKQDIEVYSNVSTMREQRCLMVQTEDQYMFIHDAIVDYLESGETEVDVNELRDYIKKQSQVDAKTGLTGLMDEFIRLAKTDRKDKFHEANKPANQVKNRYKNVYPYDDTRVKLSMKPGVDGSDYINANYVDSYMFKDMFIATQAPLEGTIGDFWRMIWEQNSQTVVMLSKEYEGGQAKVHTYWPQKASSKVERFIVELNSELTFGDYIVRELKLTNTEASVSRDIKQFQYTTWPESGSPDSGIGIIELIGQVQKWNNSINNKIVTVHCSAGVGRTGVFIALTNLIERIKTEAVVDVYQTVKKMRQQRTAMVQTRDQYEFCYRALQEYLDSFDLYANFR